MTHTVWYLLDEVFEYNILRVIYFVNLINTCYHRCTGINHLPESAQQQSTNVIWLQEHAIYASNESRARSVEIN